MKFQVTLKYWSTQETFIEKKYSSFLQNTKYPKLNNLRLIYGKGRDGHLFKVFSEKISL